MAEDSCDIEGIIAASVVGAFQGKAQLFKSSIHPDLSA